MSNNPGAVFLNPQKKCDIVMKGGITSGIVYPKTVSTLARTYRFMNIGGTSAGAIAAAATAAAEYRRQKDNSGDGFALVEGLPGVLSAKPKGSRHTKLYSLFQPDPSARFLFHLGLSLIKPGWEKAAAFLGTLVTGAPFAWLSAVGLGLLYAMPSLFEPARSSGLINLAFLIGLVLFVLLWISIKLVRAVKRLPERGFGFCSGMMQEKVPALTDWLHAFLNDVAGKPHDAPLTFGDLNGAGIQLRLLSTNITHGRPYGLPIDTKDLYFKSEELQAYFPPSVIEWMKRHPGPVSSRQEAIDTGGFSPLPHPANLPVVVAARMSLSFPFLFRAVPLYAIDFTRFRRKAADPPVPPAPGGAIGPDEPRVPERCWFLDGGLCSNFPISMFDSTLPRWPTFGINLQSVRPDRPDSFVWSPEKNQEGLGENWNRIETARSLAPIGAYIAGMFNSARNWTDNRQMTVPGYRDRIVHIRLSEIEGGLNLDMPEKVVTTISNRGKEAAQRLLKHFAQPAPGISVTWDNHRWIRFRTLLAQTEILLASFHKGYTHTEEGEASYLELLNRGSKDPPSSYRINGHQRRVISDVVSRLEELANLLGAASAAGRPTTKAPRPVPELRVLPRTVPESGVDTAPDVTLDDPANEGVRSLEDPDQDQSETSV